MISRQTLQAPDHDFPEGPRWGRGGDVEEPLGAVRNPSGAAAVEPEGDADGKLIRSPLIVMETYLSKYLELIDANSTKQNCSGAVTPLYGQQSTKSSRTKCVFFVADETDLIQKEHFHGKFYESEELRIISEFFPSGGIFC